MHTDHLHLLAWSRTFVYMFLFISHNHIYAYLYSFLKPLPWPAKTHTHDNGCGFSWVGVWVAWEYPRVTCGNPYSRYNMSWAFGMFFFFFFFLFQIFTSFSLLNVYLSRDQRMATTITINEMNVVLRRICVLSSGMLFFFCLFFFCTK